MIIECPNGCGRRVVAQADGKAYLCRRCWRQLFSTLLEVIRSGGEPGSDLEHSRERTERGADQELRPGQH